MWQSGGVESYTTSGLAGGEWSAALTTGKESVVTTEQLAGQDQGLFWIYW